MASNPITTGVRARGVTLVELIVALAVAAILMAIALPSFQDTLRSNRLAGSTNQFMASVALARSEAIRNTRGAGVCATATGAACQSGTDWTAGWMAWSDINSNGTFDAGTDTVLRFMQGNPKVGVTGPAAANAVRFDARGRIVGGEQNVILQPDSCGSRPLRRTIVIGATGQVRKTELVSCV
jgi:type IV fimbrial biogenesis protein FimT